MIVIALVGVFVSGFLFGAVLVHRAAEEWFDPWTPAAVTDRLVGTGPEWSDFSFSGDVGDWDIVPGDVPPESTTETLR